MQNLRILIAGVVMLFATALLLADNTYATPVAPHSELYNLAVTEDLPPAALTAAQRDGLVRLPVASVLAQASRPTL